MTTFQQRSATCDRARAWISLRSDGELSEFECALLDAHLGRCAAHFTRGPSGLAASAVERGQCAPVLFDHRHTGDVIDASAVGGEK